MKAVPNSRAPRLILLSLVALPPADAHAAQAHSSLEVTAQVVRGSSSAAATAALISRIERSETSASALISSGAGCDAADDIVIANDAWATCNWEPGSQTYRVTIRY